MSRLTLRLPETLHTLLVNLASREGVSLNQYIVYALTRQATLASSLQEVTPEEVSQQKLSFDDLLHSLGKVSLAEAQEILKEREVIDPESGLDLKVIEQVQQRIRDSASAPLRDR